jgi:ribosomal protein S9
MAQVEDNLVMLESADTDAINAEVEAGKHDAFDDALHYVIARGLAEIERTRKSAVKSAAKSEALKGLRELLAAKPELAGALDAKVVAALKAAGITK